MKKAILTVTAPTHYQRASIKNFNIPEIIDEPDGSFSATLSFDSYDEARQHLIDCVESFYSGGDEYSIDKRNETIDYINSTDDYAVVTLDAAYGRIELVD